MRILVDMSAVLIHHGHIRLLKQAKELGYVIVGLTSDDEIKKQKGYIPELNFLQRKEILLAIRYVDEVIESKWLIDDDFLDQNNIDRMVHGNDNSNAVSSDKLIIFERTPDISTSELRKRAAKNLELKV